MNTTERNQAALKRWAAARMLDREGTMQLLVALAELFYPSNLPHRWGLPTGATLEDVRDLLLDAGLPTGDLLNPPKDPP